jgi:Na+-driven multidrug efflux pump
VGVVLGVLVILLRPWLGPLFSPDPAVQAAIAGGLVVVALGQPLSGFVFVVDGVLIGAGDGRWLARAMLATLVAYLPVILAVNAAGSWLLEGGSTRGQVDAVIWLWLAFTAFMSVRGTLMWMRVRTDRWMVTGATLG